MLSEKNKDILNQIWKIALMVAAMMIIFNQWMSYRYKAELLMTPCQLCAKLNQNQSRCIQNCFIQINPIGNEKNNLNFSLAINNLEKNT